VAINDIAENNTLAYLLKYDTSWGVSRAGQRG